MIKNISVENRIRILIILLSLLAFLSFNGLVHLFDWDEINFAESAREMIVTGNYSTVQINFMPFWEKPPLFIWMQVLSMKMFGINEFAARFPNAICGMISLLVLFEFGKKLKNYQFGVIWAITFGASVLPFLYFKSGIIDPWFNLFIFSAIYLGYQYINQRENSQKSSMSILLSAIILGLAVLTKGPVAILLFGTTVMTYLTIERKFKWLKWSDILMFSFVLIITGGAYHLYQILSGNWKLVSDFFVYQMTLMKTEDAGHGGSIFYHPVVLFVGVFPTSIIALRAFFAKSAGNNNFRKLMIILFLVVLIIFSLVKTKIVHYSSLCYIPLAYLAAVSIYNIYTNRSKITVWEKALIAGIGFVFAISPGIIQWIATLPAETLQRFIKDDFAIACIGSSVQWNGYEFLFGAGFMLILVISLFFMKGIRQMAMLYGSTLAFVFLFMLILLPKIEKYSQGPAIEFISSMKDKPVWVSTLDYKSYAPYFYSGKPARATNPGDEQEFLITGKTNRDVYFVIKITSLHSILEQYPQLVLAEKKGGFGLLKRTVQK